MHLSNNLTYLSFQKAFGIVEEEAVWAGIRQGNKDALKALYDRYFNALYSYGMKVSQSSSNTEDAIHELFLDIWKYREGLSDTTSIRFYLYRALRRKLYKDIQSTKKTLNFDRSQFDFSEGKDTSIEQRLIEHEQKNEMNALLTNHMKNLPPRQQESLTLRFYGELSFKEIGELLGINEQSARNLVTRGLEFLRKHMKAWILFIILLM